jgi:hypothetical protein
MVMRSLRAAVSAVCCKLMVAGGMQSFNGISEVDFWCFWVDVQVDLLHFVIMTKNCFRLLCHVWQTRLGYGQVSFFVGTSQPCNIGRPSF